MEYFTIQHRYSSKDEWQEFATDDDKPVRFYSFSEAAFTANQLRQFHVRLPNQKENWRIVFGNEHGGRCDPLP